MLVTGFGDAWVVYGRSTGFAASLDLGTLDASTGIRLTGGGFALEYGGVGDANGDGIRDFIMGNSTGNGNGYIFTATRALNAPAITIAKAATPGTRTAGQKVEMGPGPAEMGLQSGGGLVAREAGRV